MAAHAVRRQDPRADPALAVEQEHQRAIDREMAAWRRQQSTIFCAEERDEEGADEEVSCLPGRSAICRRAGVIEAIKDGRAEGVLAATERLADFSASGDR